MIWYVVRKRKYQVRETEPCVECGALLKVGRWLWGIAGMVWWKSWTGRQSRVRSPAILPRCSPHELPTLTSLDPLVCFNPEEFGSLFEAARNEHVKWTLQSVGGQEMYIRPDKLWRIYAQANETHTSNLFCQGGLQSSYFKTKLILLQVNNANNKQFSNIP